MSRILHNSLFQNIDYLNGFELYRIGIYKIWNEFSYTHIPECIKKFCGINVMFNVIYKIFSKSDTENKQIINPKLWSKM
jgi:hypothetical protein